MIDLKQYHALIPTPFATLGLKTRNQTLQELDFIFEELSSPMYQNEFTEYVGDEVQQYLADARHPLSLNLTLNGTKFQRSVWRQMQLIPSGECLSYSDVALKLKSGARAVGNACRRNPIPLIVPCHRIIAKNGLGGFAGDRTGELVEVKRWLLNHESCSIN